MIKQSHPTLDQRNARIYIIIICKAIVSNTHYYMNKTSIGLKIKFITIL